MQHSQRGSYSATLNDGMLTMLLCAVICIAGVRTAQAGINWTSHGPYGGPVTALAIDPIKPSILYAGTPGGVFQSTTSGGSWSAVNTGLNITFSVTALAIDPSTPSTLYAGTNGGGVFQSTNSGGTWSAVNTGLNITFSVTALAIDPSTPGTLYAGTNGGGVLQSTNSGGNWSAVNAGLTDPYVLALAVDPTTRSTLYAGTTFSGVFTSQQVSATAPSRVTNEGCAILSDGSTSAARWPLLVGCILVLVRRRAGWRRTAD